MRKRRIRNQTDFDILHYGNVLFVA
eukprot:SAG31_NODE_31580_length_366_cov_0.970037_1_plen_24_part_01